MKEQFVTYEIALKLKELGFDEEVIATFDNNEEHELKIFAFSVPNKGIFEKGFQEGWCIKAPLWQQVIDFLKEKYQLHIYIDFYDTYAFAIKCEKDQYYNRFGSFEMELKTYYEAREQAILKAIELIKQSY